MLPAYVDDRPSPVVGALGAVALLMLVGALALVFQRSGESTLPKVSSKGGSGKIAFASNRKEDLDIYAVNADGSGRTRLTDSRSVDESPAWSPDGTKIA